MEYSIVKFLSEEDAVGIISNNWIFQDGTRCYFPNVITEDRKLKLLKTRAIPTKDWKKCEIKIIKQFPNYDAAEDRLTDAEYTSNVDSANEVEPTIQSKNVIIEQTRKRKQKNLRLPGEYSSDEEENSKLKKNKQSANAKRHKVLEFPPVPTSTITNDSSDWLAESESESIIGHHIPINTSKHIPINTSKHSDVNHEELERLKANQTTMWSVITEMIEVMKSNSSKLDRILLKLDEQSNRGGSEDSSNHMEILSRLPVTNDEELKSLNDRIVESGSLRLNLIQILMTSGGRDTKATTANMLRKLISDDVAEKFSLTGKTQKDGPPKESFERTAVYRLLTQACFKVHPQSKEVSVREAVSDWLMQAKFRKIRRGKKKTLQEDTFSENFDFV